VVFSRGWDFLGGRKSRNNNKKKQKGEGKADIYLGEEDKLVRIWWKEKGREKKNVWRRGKIQTFFGK